jgi:putative endopeptidase
MNKKTLLTVGALAAFALCAYQTKTFLDKPNDPIYKNIDTTVSPGRDFFLYANGTWLKQNPIPAAYSSWGIGNEVTEEIRDRLKKINEDALKANAPKGSGTQKIGDF